MNPTTLNRAAVLFSLLFVLGIPLFAANFRTDRDPKGDPLAGDFPQEYLGGYILLHGNPHRLYDPPYGIALQHDPDVMGMTFNEEQFLPIIYPPFYYLLVAPLALLPYYVAAIVWLGLMASCLGLTVWLLARAYPQHPTLPAWLLAGSIFFMPLLQNLISSQKATLALLILTATFLQLQRGRPFWAGVIFGLLAFKPQLTLVIGFAMLFKRQWWFVLGGASTGVGLVGLSLLVSPTACAQYLQLSGTMADYINTSGFPMEKMHCWYGFWKLLLPDQDLRIIQAATLFTGVVTVAALCRLLWGPLAFGQPAFAMQFTGLIVATILLSPHLLTYDLTLLLLPFCLLIHLLLTGWPTLEDRKSRLIWLLVLLYAAPGVSTLVARSTRVQITILLMFALLALLGHRVWVSARAASSER